MRLVLTLLLVPSFFMAFVSISVYAQAPFEADQHTIALYHFDDGASTILADSSSNGNHGEVFGPTWVTGRFGGGLAFDGQDDFVRIASSASLNALPGAQMSLEMWVRLTGGGRRAIANKALVDGSACWPWVLLQDDTELRALVRGCTGAVAAPPVPADEWHLVTLDFDATGPTAVGRLYVDGILVARNFALETRTIQPVADLYLGAAYHFRNPGNGLQDFFAGTMDELRISDVARCPDGCPDPCADSLATASTPTLLGPALGAQFQRGQPIEHRWTAQLDALHYLLDFGSAAPGQYSCVFDAPRTISGTAATYSHDDVHQPIYWRVRTVSACGDTSPPSIGYYFVGSTGGACAQLSPPRMLLPAPGARFDSDTLVVHAWNSVPEATQYLVDFATPGGDFEACSWTGVHASADTTLELDYGGLHDPLYWRLRAVLASGDTTNASVSYYSVGEAAGSIGVPHILGPAGSLESLGASIPHSWEAVAGAVRYEVQFANANPYSSNNLAQCAWDPSRSVSDTLVSYDHQSEHCPIYWRVRAVGGEGEVSNWAVANYGVGALVHSCTLGDPTGLAVPVLIGPWASTVQNSDIQHSWQRVPGASGYELEIASNASGTQNPFASQPWEISLTTSTESLTIPALGVGEEVIFRVRAITEGVQGGWAASYYHVDIPTAIFDRGVPGGDGPPASSAVLTLANFPNPFNPSTRIVFELSKAAEVSIEIYSVAGQRVRGLAHAPFEAGRHTSVWDGRDESGRAVASGLYYCRVTAAGHAVTRPLVLVR